MLSSMTRDVQDLPKAHLHLHFTGSMRIDTVRDLADQHGIRLPDALVGPWPPHLARATDERGWFRFQRLYDAARACVRGEGDMRRIVREAAHDDAAEGSRWLEIQVDPTSYAPFVGGITPALEIVLDEARAVSEEGPVGVGVVVAASRMRHPLEARTLARLAARHAGDEPGTVVGFGLSNDERRGLIPDFAHAFDIARRAGLALVPHGGELLGAQSVMETLEHLAPHRIGHGVRSVEDPQVLDAVAEAGVTLEVCPGSNVALGVYAQPGDVPLRRIVASGIRVALGADDPLLFGSRLSAQYAAARDLGFDDGELASLARGSIEASLAPERVRKTALEDVDAWLAAPA
jgi:adenosine deaminase